MAGSEGPRAIWRSESAYDYLLTVERSMFAWEWLRRTPHYRQQWARARRAGPTDQDAAARAFGLVALAAPSLSALDAHPIWQAGCDPRVVRADVCADPAAIEDLLDIRRLTAETAIGLVEDDVEHWRVVIGGRAVRLDVHGGTLLGGPTLVRFELRGLATAQPKLQPIALLIRDQSGERRAPAPPREVRARRWIAELRTADALAAGANYQAIARTLFGRSIPPGKWRAESDSFRLRVQRLARAARARLSNPLDADWFR